MKRIRLPILGLLIVGSIAACEKRDPVEDEANLIPASPTTNDSAGTVAGGPPAGAHAGGVEGGAIPAAIQGRWGLTPADCLTQPGRAQGLLTIGANEVQFYESRGSPASSVDADDRGISGNWAFSGEGETWTSYMSLKLQGDGLVRTERNPPTTFTYARCD